MIAEPEFRFLVNLRAETTTDEFRKRVRPYGWLLPPAYSSAATIRYAQEQVQRGVPVIADNGLFDDLTRISKEFYTAAAPVRSQIEQLWDRIGGPPTRAEVPAGLRAAARDVADMVETETGPLRDNHETRAEELIALSLTAYIGAEDPSPGVWLRLGIGPAGMGLLAEDWRRIGRRIAKASIADIESTPAGMGYLPVASPQDESSGRFLGDEFARANLREFSIGFGALVNDGRFGSRAVVRNQAVPLPGNLPVSYVNSMVTLKAFLDAYEARAGRLPVRLHLLGLGAPILMGLAALVCRGVTQVTVDATSPIRAAASGIIYSNRPTLLKLDPNKVALRILRDERRTGWPCRCSSCRSFHQSYPQDADVARRAWVRNGSPDDLSRLLVQGKSLGDALPLLARSRAGSMRARAARATRLGHNHWSLTQLCDDITGHLRTKTLDSYIEQVSDAYVGSASLPYAAAVAWVIDYVNKD